MGRQCDRDLSLCGFPRFSAAISGGRTEPLGGQTVKPRRYPKELFLVWLLIVCVIPQVAFVL